MQLYCVWPGQEALTKIEANTLQLLSTHQSKSTLGLLGQLFKRPSPDELLLQTLKAPQHACQDQRSPGCF